MFTQTVNKPRAVRFPSASLKGPAHEAPQLLLSIRAACVLCLCACVCVYGNELRHARVARACMSTRASEEHVLYMGSCHCNVRASSIDVVLTQVT